MLAGFKYANTCERLRFIYGEAECQSSVYGRALHYPNIMSLDQGKGVAS